MAPEPLLLLFCVGRLLTFTSFRCLPSGEMSLHGDLHIGVSVHAETLPMKASKVERESATSSPNAPGSGHLEVSTAGSFGESANTRSFMESMSQREW